MLININITVWDSYTGMAENTGTFVVDHKKDLVQLAQTDGVDPLVLEREIHQLFTEDMCQSGGLMVPI